MPCGKTRGWKRTEPPHRVVCPQPGGPTLIPPATARTRRVEIAEVPRMLEARKRRRRMARNDAGTSRRIRSMKYELCGMLEEVALWL